MTTSADTKSINDLPLQAMLKGLETAAEQILKKKEPVNIIVAGQTGFGKSALINAVFGEELAQSTDGPPVTQQASWYQSPKVPVRILDTKGLEVKDYEATLKALKIEIDKYSNEIDLAKKVHIAWVCISEVSGRLQDADLDLIRVFNDKSVPVIVVLTKATGDDGFSKTVKTMIIEKSLSVLDVLPVNSVATKFVPVHGLEELAKCTSDNLPQVVRESFISSQRSSLALKRGAAQNYIIVAATAAGTIAATPIPFSDAILLAPTQAVMLYGICQVYGIAVARENLKPLALALAGILGASVAGRVFVGALLKFIPGVGSALGGTIASVVAGTLTKKMGDYFVDYIEDYHRENGVLPKIEDVGKGFGEYIQERQDRPE